MPAAVRWFRIYCVLLCVLYIAVAAAGIVLLAVSAETLGWEPAAKNILGVLFLFMGILFFLLSFIGLHMPRRSGAWGYCYGLIFLGLTNIVFLPLCLPLLMQWKKPAVQQWFGRNVA